MIELQNGDCMELLDLCAPVDAVVTDPPYMINSKSEGGAN